MREGYRLLLIVFWVGIGVLGLQAQGDYSFHSLYRTFEEGAMQYTAKEKVVVYVAPSAAATPIDSLAIATKIEVVERMDELATFNGFRTNWYRVRYMYENKTKVGFLWGGDLAVGQMKSKHSAVLFLYTIHQIALVDRGTYQDESIRLRLYATIGQQVVSVVDFEAAGTLFTKTQGRTRGRQGLRRIRDIIEIAFNDGYCGGVSAVATIFWDGRKLHFVRLLSIGFSNQSFSRQFFVYPAEEAGRSRTIIYRREAGTIDSRGQRKVKQQKDILYIWNGAKLQQLD